MRALLIALALLVAAPARAASPLPLVERQVVTLEFGRPVARLATTDPGLLALDASGVRLRVTALRGGRAQVEVVFEDGASVTFDVTVEPARRPAAPDARPGEVVLSVGETRRVPSPGLASVLVEENGVVRAQAEGGGVAVTGLKTGRSSLVLVDVAGLQVTVPLRVVP